MMKRISLLFAAFITAAFCANAQTLNNPKDANGYFIVKWDCANETWAASNDFEVDEAFTFAVDVTGTIFDDWLKETPTNAGATRGIAINRWSGFGAFNSECDRLKQISGNIYGTTWCFTQFPKDFDVALATVPETVTYFSMQVFGFEYTAENVGAAWYVSPIEINAVDGSAFTSAPYTGTKTSEEFYADDYEGFWPYTAGGYAPTCVTIPPATGIHPVTVDSPVIGHEYYNLQGMKLSEQPENGLFIDKAKKADGSSTAQKVLKSLK